MHELGIVYNIVERVMEVVEGNDLTEVEAIVLLIGENSGVVPSYLHACFPAAVDGTMLEKTALEVRVVISNGVCGSCGKVFGINAEKGVCPQCKNAEYEVISGNEFMIKEIRAR